VEELSGERGVDDPTGDKPRQVQVKSHRRVSSHPPIIMKQLSLIREESATFDTTDSSTVESALLSAQQKRAENNDAFNPDDIINFLVMESERKSSVEKKESSENAPLLSNNNFTANQDNKQESEKMENTILSEIISDSNNNSANSSPGAIIKSRTSIRRSLKERGEISCPIASRYRRRRCTSENCGSSVRSASLADVHEPQNKKRLSLPNMPNLRRSSMSTSSSSSSILSREHREIYDRLDRLDGQKEGLLNKEVLQNFVSKTDIHRYPKRESIQMMRLLSEMDENKDGYIDPQEFQNNLIKHEATGKRPEMSKLLETLRKTAHAEEYKLWPPPVFLIFLSFAQLCLFIYHAVHLSTEHNQVISWHEPAPQCSALIFNPTRRWEAWRYLTYSLVHSGVAHIALNLAMQLFVGLPLEMSHGSLRIGVVYTSGVLFGSLATSTFDPNMFLAGASGGVYSLIMAHLASLILNWKEDIIIIRDRFRSNKMRSATNSSVYRLLRLLSVVIYSVCDITYAIYLRFTDTQNNIGYLAHLAGGIAGLMIGLIVLKNRKSEAWEKAIKIITFMVTLTIMILALAWNIKGDDIYMNLFNFDKPYFLKQDLSSVHNCTYIFY